MTQGLSKLTREVKIKKTSHVILSASEGPLKKAVEIFKKGGVVIFPTDTVYGIGCKFNDKEAIDRIYKIKKTPKNQKFPILVSSIGQVRKLAGVDKAAEKLIKKYWPGGLTIILPGINTGKIAFRMPNSELMLKLINKIGMPIIGTSANFHGKKAVLRFVDLDPKFIKLANFVLKGECQTGKESTVVDAVVNPPRILRQGAVKIQANDS